MFPNTNVILLFVKIVPEQREQELFELFEQLLQIRYLYEKGEARFQSQKVICGIV
jgi:hypothetical protein